MIDNTWGAFALGLMPGMLYACYWERRARRALRLESEVSRINELASEAVGAMTLANDKLKAATAMFQEARDELRAARAARQ